MLDPIDVRPVIKISPAFVIFKRVNPFVPSDKSFPDIFPIKEDSSPTEIIN